jgi:putative sterol carrier protein
MGRRPDMDPEALVSIVDSFFISTGGDPERITFTALSRYAAGQGLSIPEQKFRRCPAVVRRKEELRALQAGALVSVPETVPGFATPDIREGLRRCRDTAEAEAWLSGLSDSWHALYRRKTELELEDRKNKEEILRLKNMADAGKAVYARSVRELSDESSVLKAQVRELMKIINEYIYPAAAMMLLKKRIPSLVPDTAVDLDAVMGLLADQGRTGPDDVPDAASPDDAFLALASGKEDGHVF